MASPLSSVATPDGIDAVVHLVQVALTPIFLLSGVGTLLNVFNARLSRVSDHTEHLAELVLTEEDPDKAARLFAHLRRLSRRRALLDTSVVLGGAGGAATCGSAFVLFLGGLRDAEIAVWLAGLLGIALGCTVLALVAFVTDSVLGWHGLRVDGPMPRTKPT